MDVCAGLKRITKDVGHDIHEDELQDMIEMFDRNGDGVIDKASCYVAVSKFMHTCIWTRWDYELELQGEFKRILRAYDGEQDDSDDDADWK